MEIKLNGQKNIVNQFSFHLTISKYTNGNRLFKIKVPGPNKIAQFFKAESLYDRTSQPLIRV